MDRFNALGRGMQIMFVGGILLLLDSFLDWQAVDDFPGISAWHGFLGVVMGLLTIALIAWIALQLAGVDMSLPVSAAMIAAALGGLILLFALLKNLTDEFSTIWSYVGVALAAVIAFGAWKVIEAAGGVDTLRGEMPNRTSSATTAAAPPMTSAPPPVVEPQATPHEHTSTTEPGASAAPQPDLAPDEAATPHDHDHDEEHPHDHRST